MTCQLGYTKQHATFALLELVLLSHFLYFGNRVPRLLRGLISGAAIVNVAFRVLVGSMCYSHVTSTVVHAHFATVPLTRLPISLYVVHGLETAAVAAHFVHYKLEGWARMAKLLALVVLALVNILMQDWWWAHDITASTVPAGVVPAALLVLMSLVFIYSTTRRVAGQENASRAMLINLCTTLTILIAVAALHLAFPVNLEGRLINHLRSDYSDANLHWAVSLCSPAHMSIHTPVHISICMRISIHRSVCVLSSKAWEALLGMPPSCTF